MTSYKYLDHKSSYAYGMDLLKNEIVDFQDQLATRSLFINTAFHSVRDGDPSWIRDSLGYADFKR